METMKVTFQAEVKEVKAVKSISNDKAYRVVLTTEDDQVKELIDFSPDRLYQVALVELPSEY